MAVCEEMLSNERELELRFSGEFLFINGTRLRLDLTNYASFGYLLRLCRAAGVGAMRVSPGVTPREWLVVLSVVDAASTRGPEERFLEIGQGIEATGVRGIELGPPVDHEGV